MIIKAGYEDVDDLVRLVNTGYRGEESRKGWTTEADLIEGERTDANEILTLMNKPDAAFLKYSSEDKNLQGCVYLEKRDKKMYLGMLTVSPLLQSKGIGKQLLFASEKYAKEQKCSLIEMTVISIRQELINWYERHGYKKNRCHKTVSSKRE